MTNRELDRARELDLELRKGADVLARWSVAQAVFSEPARVIEIRPHTLQVKTRQGDLVLLPRAHSVRWSSDYGAFPLAAQ